jgi:hypothetical protein
LHNLNDDLKAILNEYRTNDNLLPSNTLFNYSSFINYLNTRKFISFVRKWFENSFKTLEHINNYDSEFNFERLIHMSLLKIFIENNEVNLHTLYIEARRLCDHSLHLVDILELMLQNPNFFHNIKNLKINIHLSSSNNILFDNHISKIENCILQVINLQKNLRGILLGYNSLSLYQSSLSNYSNTLNTIILYHVNFNGIINLNKIFEQLNVLESVHIIYCSYLDTHFIQQIINLTKPFKLKSLFINEYSQIDESLLLLLQKSGGYLENLECSYSYDLPLEQQILESMIKYCKNVKFLNLFESGIKFNYQIFNLIENIKQNLNYLTIGLFNDYHYTIEFSSIILQNLGQILPFKLKYLNLYLSIKANDLKVFLNNSQNTFIEKLLIHNNKIREDSDEELLLCIKEYIMKKKKVKYLSYIRENMKDLLSMKDEVKEFGLYNIKVQDYYKSMINIFYFI